MRFLKIKCSMWAWLIDAPMPLPLFVCLVVKWRQNRTYYGIVVVFGNHMS